MYNIKDIIRMNQEIGEDGLLLNRSVLEFALDRINKEKSWLRQSAFIIRAIICDHAFHEGNKRTAYIFIAAMFEMHNYEYDGATLVRSIHAISRENIVDITRIERLLQNAIDKQHS